MDFKAALLPLVDSFIVLDERQWSELENHFQLFLKWNDHMNLSAVREPEEIVERHFAESLFCASYLPPGILSVVDIGSGGGFPGVPIAIAYPALHVTLLDSHTRKCVFLREITRNLSNVTVSNTRLESTHAEYGLAVTRGVSWSHMRKFLRNVSRRLLLLSTAEEWSMIRKDSAWDWNELARLPWGDKRLLVEGRLL